MTSHYNDRPLSKKYHGAPKIYKGHKRLIAVAQSILKQPGTDKQDHIVAEDGWEKALVLQKEIVCRRWI
jgi:hypothetical protein